MSKAQQIRKLYGTGKYTTGQIATKVGCRTEYVRTAARQRTKTGGPSKSDRKWMIENRERHLKLQRDAQRRLYWRRKAEAHAS